ncbi:MAG: hypothetical protein M1418_02750 [Deltaproteobacteria bacterium]|nr:hypothetical protein [Deltaproteobacteria bacterium]
MKIRISTASPDALARETLILGFFSDERPPKGYCGLVDWRLNGMISTEIAEGRISGSFLEKIAYAFPPRIRVSRLLLFGMGVLSELTYDRLYNAGFEMAKTVTGIGATDLALPMPAAGRGSLQLAGMTEALITGIFDGSAQEPERLPTLGLEIPAKVDDLSDIRMGLERFLKHTEAAEIEIFDSEMQTADNTEEFLFNGKKVQSSGD